MWLFCTLNANGKVKREINIGRFMLCRNHADVQWKEILIEICEQKKSRK